MRSEARASDWELVSWKNDRDTFSIAEHLAFKRDTMLRFFLELTVTVT